jgi:hypothetical protein
MPPRLRIFSAQKSGAQTDPGELARAGCRGFEALPSPSPRPASIRYLTGLPPG